LLLFVVLRFQIRLELQFCFLDLLDTLLALLKATILSLERLEQASKAWFAACAIATALKLPGRASEALLVDAKLAAGHDNVLSRRAAHHRLGLRIQRRGRLGRGMGKLARRW